MALTSQTSWLPWRAWVALLLLAVLAGCATKSGVGSIPAELQTASDESDVRTRARTRLMLASSYYENGQTAIALDETKKALQADPTFSDAYNLGGLIYMAMGEQELAQSHFKRAIALKPRDADAMHNLGWLQCQQRQYAEAAQSFQRAITVPSYQGRAKTLMTQGICEARSGNLSKAVGTLMRSYELDADNPVTGYNLSRLLYQSGDYTRARTYIRRLNNSELANAESLWLGIRVENKLNNRQAMEQLASQLRRRFPESNELASYERGAFDE
ncbi:MAG: type IV pilus biogenesis/stability protein PilW [Burkholderiaceae bacterium]|jgi:type IV pilus assembly protein PilF|nr:type IV pilus biogenesis/stability protein PilW [Burkholderiaceae bacterium]